MWMYLWGEPPFTPLHKALCTSGFEDPRYNGTPVVQRNLWDLREKPRPHPTLLHGPSVKSLRRG